MRNFMVFDIGGTTVKYAVINEGCFRIYMLNLSLYSDDWSGYTRLLRDKQDRETPHRGGSISNRGDLIEQIYKKLDFIMSLEINAEVRPVIEPCLFKNDANLLWALFHSLQREEVPFSQNNP